MGPRIVGDSKPYTFKYTSPEKDFNLEIRFRRSRVEASEVAAVLKAVADELDQNHTGD